MSLFANVVLGQNAANSLASGLETIGREVIDPLKDVFDLEKMEKKSINK